MIVEFNKYVDRINEHTYTVYHGSDKDFKSFDDTKFGTGAGSNWYGQGFYFSDAKPEASLYGDNIYKVKITLDNPIDLTKIKDSSVQGSGLVRFFTSIDELGKLEYQDYTFNKLTEILNKLEQNFDYDNVFFSEGTNKKFKTVIYETDEKDYMIYNRTNDEIESKEYLKKIIISKILDEKYGINRLPITIDDATSPYIFTSIVKQKGYDGVIANNSNIVYGKEYIVFDKSNIEIVEKIK